MMFATSLRSTSLNTGLVVAILLLGSLCTFAGAANRKAAIEESSLVQRKIVMKSGVRKVQPLEEDEDLEEDPSATDDDTPSLMQERICTKKSKSKLQPLIDEDIDDELSMIQTDVALNRAEEDEYGIEEEEEFSAMQTSVTMMAGERHVGTGRPFEEQEEDDFDGASFMQNEATFIKKSERLDTSCTNGQLECNSDDDVTDEVSLMQTDVVLNRADAEDEGQYGIEEEEEFSAMQTSVTMMSGERHVGTGRSFEQEEDEFDGASFMQNEATFIKKSERADTKCTNGQLDGNSDDDDATDEVSLMQTDIVLNKVSSDEDGEYGIEEDDESSFMQTSVTMMHGERHVGTSRPYSEEEDDFDGASFMQSEATFIKKSDRTDTSCANQVDEEESDVFSL